LSIHVAILKRPYIEKILLGQKSVESRLSKFAGPPHGQVLPGDRLFFKASAGPFLATAIADTVFDRKDQTAAEIERLAEAWDAAVAGGMAYWTQRFDRPFVTLIRLKQIEPMDVGPKYTSIHMRAWYVLHDDKSPLRDVRLTAGSIRNRYVNFPHIRSIPASRSVTLVMPDDVIVETNFAKGSMLRWRGWGRYFRAFGLIAGDRVRFIALGDGRYSVRFMRQTSGGCSVSEVPAGRSDFTFNL
jgi:hypothetical protein